MTDRSLYPPRCCRQVIPWDTVRYLVSENLATQFDAKREELEDKFPVYCHDKQCSKYIKADAQDLTKATCSSCHAQTCTLCKQATHEGACPDDEEVQKMREYAKEEGNQECGQCHQLVELSVGCNHITFVQGFGMLLLNVELIRVFASTSSATAAVRSGSTALARCGTRLAFSQEPTSSPTGLAWEELPLRQILPKCFVAITVTAMSRAMDTWRRSMVGTYVMAALFGRHVSYSAAIAVTRSCAIGAITTGRRKIDAGKTSAC